MSDNIINLIRRDFYALWTEKGVGAVVFLSLIFMSPAAPVWKFITLIFLPIILQMYSSNTFILEEKYRTERFFASLPVRRRDIVLSRYYGVVVILAVHLILAYSGNLAFKFAGLIKFQIPPGYFALTLIVSSLPASITFPVYFKFGATKAMNGLTLGLMGVFYAVFFAVFKIPGLFEKIRKLSLADDFVTSLLLTGTAILVFVLSIKISTAIYSKRDL